MLNELVKLMPKMPSGLVDRNAPQKLLREFQELEDAVTAGRVEDILHEVADCVWYSTRCMVLAATLGGVTMRQAFAAALAKYNMRAAAGNPKDVPAEKMAILSAVAQHAPQHQENRYDAPFDVD